MKATAPSKPRRRAVENEIKLAVRDAAFARRLLRANGFTVWKPRAFESNILFDRPDLSLRRQGALLRVRQARREAWLTYKGPATSSRHKTREEIETECLDGRDLEIILERLGFGMVFRYEKRRTEYRGPGSGLIMLDETPIGVFLELEGPPGWIDRTARHLGFSRRDYLTASYGRLYTDWCARQGRKPGDMLFRP